MLKVTSILTILFSLVIAGCSPAGNDENSASIANGNALSRMLDSFQIALPDGSYGTDSSLNTFAISANPGSNFLDLKARVDAVASGLKESEIKLAQVLKEGSSENNNLEVIHEGLNATLVGTESGDGVNWVYKLGGKTVFTGSTASDGLTGKLFVETASVDVEWSYSSANGASSKTISVKKRGGGGNLTFVYSFSTNGSLAVELTSGFANDESVTGKWDKSGGSYKTESKECSWTADLQNKSCK